MALIAPIEPATWPETLDDEEIDRVRGGGDATGWTRDETALLRAADECIARDSGCARTDAKPITREERPCRSPM